jgi:putative aldouronate transport system substrate-binding protein
MKKWSFAMIRTIMLCLAVMLAATACTQENSSSPSPASSTKVEEKPVELTWYYIVYEMPTDLPAVQNAVNAYIQPKINATVKLMPIIESAYGQKMNTMLAAGESFDLAWTARWGGGDYTNRVLKGAYLDLDTLLEKTPKLKAAMPELAWTDTMLAGKIWAVPNYQVAAKAEGFIIQKRFIDKYKIDVSKIKTQADIEPVLEIIKANEPGIIPIAGSTNMFDYGKLWGFAREGFRVNDPNYRNTSRSSNASAAGTRRGIFIPMMPH